MMLEVPSGWQRVPARKQDESSVMQEKLKTLLEITAGLPSMPTSKQNEEGASRELKEVSVRLEDASRDGRQSARDGVMMILCSGRLEAIRGRTGQPTRNTLFRRAR
jgi:hypothetical protein